LVGNLELEKQLKLVKKTGSYLVGRREVSSSLKGSKLLVWSASANVPQTILDECKSLSVPAIKFAGNPVELGRACGIPFRVSVIALKSTGDADLSAFSKSSDYYSGVMIAPPKDEPKEVAPAKKEEEPKPKRETKKKEETKPEKKAKKATDTEEKKSRKKTDSENVPKKAADESEPKKKSTRKKKKADDEEEE
jgi:large subunit ribosomal protein L30e